MSGRAGRGRAGRGAGLYQSAGRGAAGRGAAANPFDLAARGPPGGTPQSHPPHHWTEEEIAEKLVGFIEIPSEMWENIRYGTQMRYFTKKDGFRYGGFVKNNPYDTTPYGGTEVKRYMRIQNGFGESSPGHITWVAAYEDLDKVYVKPDAAVLMLMAAQETIIQKVNENIRKLAEHSKKLEARIAALEK